MRIGIVGAGPAGLYFALLMKRHDPAHQVRVIEQNAADATFGFGVVFSERALGFLRDADPESYADIEAQLQTWRDQVIVHRDQRVRIDGLGFSGIGRLELLQVLQRHCQRRGVELTFGTRLSGADSLADYDLIVGADGVNSFVRHTYREFFEPSIEVLDNKYVWYGTEQPFECLTLTFRENADGAFVAHHYRHSPTRSTFVVECDAATWQHAGLGSLSEEDSRQYCQRVFAPDLGGYPLLTNKSTWISFHVVSNQHWTYRNVVLIGDALRSVHFSIGSGTRMALQDGVELARALADAGDAADVERGLLAFEHVRRPQVETYLDVAAESFRWYADFRARLDLDPVAFAYDYVMRGGRISHARLQERSPGLASAYEAYVAQSAPTAAIPSETPGASA